MDDYGKPLYDNLQYCTRCCMPETNEGIVFDEFGICQACQSAEQKIHINWKEREKQLREIFQDYKPKISSTKSLSGHSLGATSAHEAIYSLIMMKNNFISASVNITDMDDEAKKNPIVTKVEKDITLNSIMSNSFGFGGTNATLVFEKV